MRGASVVPPACTRVVLLMPSRRLLALSGALPLLVALFCALFCGVPGANAASQDAGAESPARYALVIAGASGGERYAAEYARATVDLSQMLVDRLRFDPARVLVLREGAGHDREATAAVLRRVLGTLRRQLRPGDLLFTILIGHGTFDGADAKFNLVGPDLASAEWASLLAGLPGRLVFVNTTASSFPFLERLAGPHRIVVSATDSAAQRFDTVFAGYFATAFDDEAADIDKNGRVSVWEAFAAAGDAVRRHYQQRGQLATERALLDDNGDGKGRDAAGQGEDGSLASRTYLDPAPPGAPPTDDVLVGLLQRRASLLAAVEELVAKKVLMPAEEYARELERLMIALARVTRDLRVRAES